jgi:hypothetical protein
MALQSIDGRSMRILVSSIAARASRTVREAQEWDSHLLMTGCTAGFGRLPRVAALIVGDGE